MQAQVTIHTSPPGSLCSPPLPGSRDPGTISPGEHTAPQALNNFFYFNNFIFFLPSVLLSFFPSFPFLPFLLSRVDNRLLVLGPGVRPEPLRWESQVQDIGPPETSRPQVISNGKSSSRDLHLNAKTQLHSTTSKLQCWTLYARQLARREHKPTH